MPHRAVIREGAENTKMLGVYDCSACEGDSSPSLNDCVDVGQSLQNTLLDVLDEDGFTQWLSLATEERLSLRRALKGKIVTLYAFIGSVLSLLSRWTRYALHQLYLV